MSDIQYNLQFDKLCGSLQLGELVGTPEAVSGGLLHRMYAVSTTKGKYAVKALNPQIMLRPDVMQNYINSEKIADIAQKVVPVVASKRVNGNFMHKVDGQYYMVFDWINGRSLKGDEINASHCGKIGGILARIHMTDFSETGIIYRYSESEQITNWQYYLEKGKKSNSVWTELMSENIDYLYEINNQANEVVSQLASNMVLSHRDLDPKNVMWDKDEPFIIDWEAAGYINPMYDLAETAFYWSGNGSGVIDEVKLTAFIDGYKKIYGALNANWRTVLLNSFLGKLEWLEYSLKRSLMIECTDKAEQQMGTSHVTDTINEIRRFSDMIPELERMLNNEVHLT